MLVWPGSRSCSGDRVVQLGAVTPAFFAFRDREHVLNLIESATGGRFHPNFDRIGGLKEDLPKGFIDECRATTRRGTPCQRTPLPQNGYCPSHQHLADPGELSLAA